MQPINTIAIRVLGVIFSLRGAQWFLSYGATYHDSRTGKKVAVTAVAELEKS